MIQKRCLLRIAVMGTNGYENNEWLFLKANGSCQLLLTAQKMMTLDASKMTIVIHIFSCLAKLH